MLVGLLAIADTVKPSAPIAVSMLHKMGITVYMMTGDNQHTANAIAKQVTNNNCNLLPYNANCSRWKRFAVS